MVPIISRLNILEVESGVCVFDKTWDWHGIPQAQGISSLVKTFIQFSREVDTGEVTKARFENPPPERERRTVGAMMSIRKPVVPISQDPTGMCCLRQGELLCACFHRISVEDRGVQEIARRALNAFLEEFSGKLGDMKPQFANLATVDNPDPAELEVILRAFAKFEQILDKILLDEEEIEPVRPSAASQ